MTESDNNRKDSHVNAFGKGYTGGPFGVGDPNDMSMRHVEDFVFVTQIVKDRSNLEKCKDVIRKWGECMENSGFGSFITCRKQVNEMNNCLRYWYTNKDFRKECEEIYLEKRKRFRETGIIEKEEKKPYYVSLKKMNEFQNEHKKNEGK